MKHFKLKLIALFLLILVGCIALASIFGQTDYFFTQLVLGAIIFILIVQCFYLIDTTNREIGKFLFALEYLDSSLSFPENTKNSFQQLYQGLNRATEQMALKAEQQNQQAEWMKVVIQRMPYGVILLNKEGKILFQNDFFTELLAIPTLQHLSELKEHHLELAQTVQSASLERREQSKTENGQELVCYKVGVKQDEEYEIVFLQGIEDLKGSIELDAWMRLIRVLTHEIMNSITSISSLASTLHESIKAEQLPVDMELAAASIKNRSQSLITFTESYRSVSDIKATNKTWFLPSEVIQQQVRFLSKELAGISVNVKSDKEQQIHADLQQVEQVFINLFLNAATALKGVDQPRVCITIWQDKTNCKVSFEDNGRGIPTKDQNQIFVPFFTTRTNGKGIGLSLSRQLMHHNNGAISLQESKEGKTIFQIQFRI